MEKAFSAKGTEISLAFRPIVRGYLGLTALYYVYVTLAHLMDTDVRAYMPVLCGIAALTCLITGFLFQVTKNTTSFHLLEVSGCIVNWLMLINTCVLFYYQFHEEKLIYFILMVLVFSTSGISTRVILANSLLALACLYTIILTQSPALLSNYIYVSVAGAFAAVGMTTLMRKAVLRAVEGKILAEEREKKAQEATSIAENRLYVDSTTGLPNRRDYLETLEGYLSGRKHKVINLLIEASHQLARERTLTLYGLSQPEPIDPDAYLKIVDCRVTSKDMFDQAIGLLTSLHAVPSKDDLTPILSAIAKRHQLRNSVDAELKIDGQSRSKTILEPFYQASTDVIRCGNELGHRIGSRIFADTPSHESSCLTLRQELWKISELTSQDVALILSASQIAYGATLSPVQDYKTLRSKVAQSMRVLRGAKIGAEQIIGLDTLLNYIDGAMDENLRVAIEACHDASHQSDYRWNEMRNALVHATEYLDDFIRQAQFLITESYAQDRSFTVFLVGLDKFKAVNDTFGYKNGDAILQKIADIIRNKVPDSSYVARVGGDEFAIIVRQNRKGDILKLAESLSTALTGQINLGENTVYLSTSIGIKICDYADMVVGEVLEHVGYALKRAKTECPGSYVLFEAHDSASIRRHFEIEQALRNANLSDELDVVFQPQHDLKANRPTGFEALARWTSPTLGKIQPDEFIKVAESAGVIQELTRILLRKTLLIAKSWPEDIGVSFNLSAPDVADKASIRGLIDIVRRSGITPGRVTFELTETTMVESFDRTCEALQLLSKAGHKIALDDFGTGYSSLSYLHKLPVDKVKIDRSFVQRLKTDDLALAIIEAIETLSKRVKMDCIIEGVETEEELAILKRTGARYIQGYIFGKPMSADMVARHILADQLRMSKKVRRKAA